MRKKIAASVLILIFSLCISACGKKADPIVLPSAEKISSIEIPMGIEDIICTEEDTISDFVEKVAEATPTRKESVQDVPAVSEYTRVDLVYDDKIESLFIYQEGDKWYIEQPYQGIYETDETILGMFSRGEYE